MGILICLLPLLLVCAPAPSNGNIGFSFLDDAVAFREQNMMDGGERGLHLQRELITEEQICTEIGGVVDYTRSVCCLQSCGTCGGEHCQYRTGGASGCCVGTIQASMQYCGTPPCVINTTIYESDHLTCEDVGGIPGQDNVCCASSCEACGGEGCDYFTGGASNCCRGDILSAGHTCGGGINAPCVLPIETGGDSSTPTPSPVPDMTAEQVCNDVGGIISGTSACCPESCGSCGGEGCDARTGGASNCCAGHIEAAGIQCGQPPCIPDPAFYNPPVTPTDPYEMCNSIGGVTSPAQNVCCSLSCEICGGEGCDTRNGGASHCCQGTIESSGVTCGSPPCILPDISTPPPPTNPAQICESVGGIFNGGTACCHASCGECGGEGCDTRPGGSATCCSGSIQAAGVICGPPPCLVDPAHYGAPSVMGPDPTCSTGVAGTHGDIYNPNPETCCANECGLCGGFGCRAYWEEGGGASQCCSGSINAQNRPCTEFGPPCIMVYDTGYDVPMVYPYDTLTAEGIALFLSAPIFYAPYKGLTGAIPPEIGQLINTQVLDLKFNDLEGSLPTELGALQNLVEIHLNSNSFTGVIPESLGYLPYLEYINLGQNSLSGSIPYSLGSLTNIHTIDLSYSSLTGSIPSSILDMTNLFRLKLIGNNLSGEIPYGLSELANLKDIQLYGNQLSGHIPADLGDKTEMFEFDLSDNQLNGPIPTSFGNLVGLKGLILNDNMLSGPIPLHLGNLGPDMKVLFLHNNQLEGHIPPELGNIQAMMFLHAYNNNLNGHLPSELQNAHNLFALRLQNNNLSGHIPSALGNLQKLAIVNLSNNELTGSIPSQLGQCSELMILRLANNNLEGNYI